MALFSLRSQVKHTQCRHGGKKTIESMLRISMKDRIPLHNVRLLLLLLIWCGFLLFHSRTIGIEDYWLDEIISYNVAKLPTPAAIWEQLRTEFHAPLYYWNLHYFQEFAEPRSIHLRWLSVFWALVAMAGFYFWMRWSFGSATALVSGLLLAVSPFWLSYCRELRMYTMYPAFLWWGAGTLILATATKKRFWWLVSGVLNSLALWTHFHAAFFVAAEMAALITILLRTKEKSLRSGILIFSATIVLLSSPLLALIINIVLVLMPNTRWIPTPKWYGLYTCFFEDYIVYGANLFSDAARKTLRYSILLYLGLVALTSLLKPKDRKTQPHGKPAANNIFPLLLLISTAIIPVSLMFLLSFSPVKFFLPGRYTILSLAPFLGILALILWRIKAATLRYAFIFYLLSLNVLSTALSLGHREKPDWKTLASVIDRSVQQGDVLVATPLHWANAYFYYSSRKHPVAEFEDLVLQSSHQPTTLYHLMFNYAGNDNPFFPWITVQFMNQKWERTVLFTDRWYTLTRYDNVNFTLLRQWYLKRGIWGREEILSQNPVAFTGAEEIAQVKESAHFGALQIDQNGEVYCWLHSPPVPIVLRGGLPPGDYVMKLRAGIGLFPKPPPYTVVIEVNGRELAIERVKRKGVVELAAQFHQSDRSETTHIVLRGDWCRPADFDPTSSDNRKLLMQFYWLAILRE
jgi:uncharacterized membrane protein